MVEAFNADRIGGLGVADFLMMGWAQGHNPAMGTSEAPGAVGVAGDMVDGRLSATNETGQGGDPGHVSFLDRGWLSPGARLSSNNQNPVRCMAARPVPLGAQRRLATKRRALHVRSP
jgi:hypothetical protein